MTYKMSPTSSRRIANQRNLSAERASEAIDRARAAVRTRTGTVDPSDRGGGRSVERSSLNHEVTGTERSTLNTPITDLGDSRWYPATSDGRPAAEDPMTLSRPWNVQSQPTSRAVYDEPPATIRLVVGGADVVRTMTACLDDAPCRESARRIYRALYHIALDVARVQGTAASVTRVLFHLPAELLMAYIGLKKSAFYDNLLSLRRSGVVACEAHMGDLHGEGVATGTVWAVALQPERVLSGHAAPMRLRAEDLRHAWRDLNRDVREGRTVWNILHPRAAAGPEGQEIPRVEISHELLVDWAIPRTPPSESDTLTVRPSPAAALEVVWALGAAAQARRHDRAAIVDRQARLLAAAFGDGSGQLGYWRKLIWGITRGIDIGENLAGDVGAVLARVLTDVRHDLTMEVAPPRRPGAVAVTGLRSAGLLDRLQAWNHLPVASRPATS